jgi:isoquinoline 1-oxidoreductase beta subunit
VKVLWSREEDMTHDFYHPIAMAKMTAGIDAGGNITGMHIKVAGQSINATLAPQNIKMARMSANFKVFMKMALMRS